jgi:uncharacterized protein (TIGR02271 family)
MNQRIMEGQPVYDTDGNELGTVKEVRGSYFRVDAPMAPDYWLRSDALSATGADGGIVVMDDAEHYSEPGAESDMATRTSETRTPDMDATATRDRDMAATGYATTERAGMYDRDRVERTEGDQTLELREERLRVDKEREQAGEVRLGKQVVEETQSVEVPLREERVVIERHAGSGEAVGGEIGDTGEEIEVPVMKERAEVEKETVVAEEVGVRKEAVERTEQVQATLRREELEVEGDDVTTDRGNLNAPRTAEYEREQLRRDR